MSKVKARESAVSRKMLQSTKKQRKKKTKKRRWRNEREAPENVHIKKKAALPPKDCQQFSANWRSLQELLKVKGKVKKQEAKRQDSESVSAEDKLEEEPIKNIPTKKTTDKVMKDMKNGKRTRHGLLHTSPQNDRTAETQKRKRIDGQTPVDNNQQKKIKKFDKEGDKKLTDDDIWFDDVDPDDIEAAVGTEAADIVRSRQGIRRTEVKSAECSLVKCGAFEGLTKAVAMDCEMVGVGADGQESIVARVSLVNQFGKCVYDKYVKQTERVTDYRTNVSGIRPQDLKSGEDVKTVQKEVSDILKGRILVGHAVHNDLQILFLDHPKKKIRDTQKYKPFKAIVKSGRPSLKLLCEKILNVQIQQGEHSSVQDAQATMRLYTSVKKQWESSIKEGLKNGQSAQTRRMKCVRKNTN